MIILFGKIVKLLIPIIEILKPKIGWIFKYITVFYDAFNYADSITPPPYLIEELSYISSKPYDDLKTMIARAYIKEKIQIEGGLKDAAMNALIELVYYFRKYSANR